MKSKWWIFGTVALLCLIGGVTLVYSALHTTPPQNSSAFAEAIKTFFLCLGGIGVLLLITLNVVNAIEQRRFDKIESTFNLLSKWDDSHLLAARSYTRKIKKEKSKISDDELISRIEGDDSLEQSVILVTNYFEHVRFSITNKRIDVREFKISLGQTLIEIIDRFWPYYKTKLAAACTDLESLKRLLA